MTAANANDPSASGAGDARGRRTTFIVGGPDRLGARDVGVSTRVDARGVAQFRLESCDVDAAAYGPDARVAVEAERRATDSFAHVDVGPARDLVTPSGWTEIAEFLGDERISFRFMIYDGGTKRFLAVAHGVRVETDSQGSRPAGRLLHFRVDPNLTDRIYEVDASSCDGAVVHLNPDAGDAVRRLNEDPFFSATLVQGVLRRVLGDVLVSGDRLGVPDPTHDDWRAFTERAGADTTELDRRVREDGPDSLSVRDWLDRAEALLVRQCGLLSAAGPAPST